MITSPSSMRWIVIKSSRPYQKLHSWREKRRANPLKRHVRRTVSQANSARRLAMLGPYGIVWARVVVSLGRFGYAMYDTDMVSCDHPRDDKYRHGVWCCRPMRLLCANAYHHVDARTDIDYGGARTRG
eukprot:2845530-Rhodomonas_salina.1